MNTPMERSVETQPTKSNSDAVNLSQSVGQMQVDTKKEQIHTLATGIDARFDTLAGSKGEITRKDITRDLDRADITDSEKAQDLFLQNNFDKVSQTALYWGAGVDQGQVNPINKIDLDALVALSDSSPDALSKVKTAETNLELAGIFGMTGTGLTVLTGVYAPTLFAYGTAAAIMSLPVTLIAGAGFAAGAAIGYGLARHESNSFYADKMSTLDNDYKI